MLPVSKQRFLQLATNAAAQMGHTLGDLKPFLEFAFEFPTLINKKGGIQLAGANTEADIAKFLSALLSSYFNKRASRVSLNAVRTVADPAVDTVLQSFAGVSKTELQAYSNHHRVSMAAENKVGELLELYLSEVLEPKGWLWLCGNLLTGVDFFRETVKNGTTIRILLQVKNRDNSENSSSSRIRELMHERGCPVVIEKWHRSQAADGQTCWESFPGNENLKLADEKRFQAFLRDYPKRR